MAPSDLCVMIGMPAYKDMPWQVSKSLLETYRDWTALGGRLAITILSGSAVVTKARSDIVHRFLSSECNRLFWIDSDIEWKGSDFITLLGLTAHMDIVGASYPMKSEPPTYCVTFTESQRADGRIQANAHGCISVQGMGLGFTVMSREVVEKVAASKPWILDEMENRFIRDVFRIDTVPLNRVGVEGECPPELVGKPLSGWRGEDMAFFADCREQGYQVWMCPGIDLGHIGAKTYRGPMGQGVTRE